MTIDDAQKTFHTAMNELRGAVPQPPLDTVRANLDEARHEIGWAIAHGTEPSLAYIEERIDAACSILDAAERSYGNGTRPNDIYRLIPDPD